MEVDCDAVDVTVVGAAVAERAGLDGVDGDNALFRVSAPALAFADLVDDEERDRDDDASSTLIGVFNDDDAAATVAVVAGAAESAKYLLMMALSTFAVLRMGFVSSKRDINCFVDVRCDEAADDASGNATWSLMSAGNSKYLSCICADALAANRCAVVSSSMRMISAASRSSSLMFGMPIADRRFSTTPEVESAATAAVCLETRAKNPSNIDELRE